MNSGNDISIDDYTAARGIDADQLAQKISNPKSVNLIVLGYALACAGRKTGDGTGLFCSLADIKNVLRKKFSRRKPMLGASIKALEAGYNKCLK